MSGEHYLPMVKANELCRRAADHYLAQVADDPLVNRRSHVRYSVPRRDLTPDADGWIHISNLVDDLDRLYFSILWHPETDKLRLKGPW